MEKLPQAEHICRQIWGKRWQKNKDFRVVDQLNWADSSDLLTFFICEHFFLSTEHGFQHGVFPGQHLQCGVKQHPSNIEPNILVAQTNRSSITAGLGLGTSQRRGWRGGLRLAVLLGKAAFPWHVPLEVDDHPADGGPKVPRRGDSYWWGHHNLSLLHVIPRKTQSPNWIQQLSMRRKKVVLIKTTVKLV